MSNEPFHPATDEEISRLGLNEDYSTLVGPDGWWTFLGEPEDCTWYRDGAGAVDMLNDQHAEIARLTAELATSARAYLDTRDEYTEAASCREEARRALLDVGIALGVDVPPLDEIEPVRANWQRYAAATVEAAKATAAARAVTPDVEASQPATVGGLLATAPDGVAETADGAQFRYIASKSPGVGRVEARSFRNAAWGAWSPSVIVAYYLRTPARPVPAHLADADPASRGPIGEVPDVR